MCSRFHRWIRSIFITPGTSPIPPPFDWLRSLFCVDLVNLLQTLGVDVVVCIYDAFMARVVVMLGVGVRVRVRDVGWLCWWLCWLDDIYGLIILFPFS